MQVFDPVEDFVAPEAWGPASPLEGLYPRRASVVLSVPLPYSLTPHWTLMATTLMLKGLVNRLVSEAKATRGQQSTATALHTHFPSPLEALPPKG